VRTDAPLRLLLGQFAYETGCESMRKRLADMERSRDVAASADFPSA
jgi:hypothetical protein